MKLFKDSRGVAHLAVFIVMALAAIGFVGWASWNAWQANKKDYETVNPQSQDQLQSDNKTTPVISYFTFKEFGVKFPSKDFPGFSYVVSQDHENTTLMLRSSSFESYADKTDPDNFCEGGPLGLFYRDRERGSNSYGRGMEVAYLEGYAYHYTPTLNACSENSAVQSRQAQLMQSLAEALKKLQLAN